MLVIAGVVTAAGAAGTLVAARQTADAVQRVPGVAEALSPASLRIENFLLVGSDSRAGGDPNTGDVGDVTGSRSDTIMVLRTDPSGGPAALLSIPRDLYVTIAGTDRRSRINSAFNSGPASLVQTVQQELGVPVHHYVEIDFNGFKALVDALGGVNLCFLYPTRDLNTGLNVTVPGCQVLDGLQSLAYARSRQYEEFRDGDWRKDPTADLGRTTRQRDFVNRALQGALQRIKVDPLAAGELIESIGAAVAIDEELDPIQAGSTLRTAVGSGLLSVALPVDNATIDGNSVLLLGDGADGVLDYFRGGSDVPPPTGG
jgi:LCP family protein required for cell wall assembly